MNTEEKLDNHETRISRLEADEGRLDERLAALVRSTDSLKKVNYCFTLLMLLAILYMAIGRQGYKDVVGSPLLSNNT